MLQRGRVIPILTVFHLSKAQEIAIASPARAALRLEAGGGLVLKKTLGKMLRDEQQTKNNLRESNLSEIKPGSTGAFCQSQVCSPPCVLPLFLQPFPEAFC